MSDFSQTLRQTHFCIYVSDQQRGTELSTKSTPFVHTKKVRQTDRQSLARIDSRLPCSQNYRKPVVIFSGHTRSIITNRCFCQTSHTTWKDSSLSFIVETSRTQTLCETKIWKTQLSEKQEQVRVNVWNVLSSLVFVCLRAFWWKIYIHLPS